MSLTIRPYQPQDAAALAGIFYHAVHQGAARHYTARERRAWAPRQPDATTWARRLDGLLTHVAVRGDCALGFMSADPGGYLDLAFVDPDHAGRGVGRSVLASLESKMRETGVTLLTTEASLAARNFFLRQGWSGIARQTVVKNGVNLLNWRMKKTTALV